MKEVVFLVTWWVSVTTSVSCPDYKPDPITGQYPSTMCAVAHFKTSEIKKDSLVVGKGNLKSLLSEINKRKKLESDWVFSSGVTKVQIDTIQ